MSMRSAVVVAGLALGLMSGSAKASVLINIDDVGSNVVLTGNGTIDISNLTVTDTKFFNADSVRGNPALLIAGADDAKGYDITSGPTAIGRGNSQRFANLSSGDLFAVFFGRVYLPLSYVSKSELNFSETFLFSTVASLGLTEGKYIFNLPNDTVTFNIGVNAVPLPAAAPMFGAAVLALGLVRYGAKRKKAAAAT